MDIITNTFDQKRIKKAWGNGGLMIREEVSRLLSEHGFVADPLGTEARFLTWSRSLEDGISQEVAFECFEYNDRGYFRSGLAVYSSRVHSVRGEINYRECYGPTFPIKPPSNTCVLFAGEVEWWAAYHENLEALLTEKAYDLWFVKNEPLQEISAWYRTFLQYGQPLLESVNTPAKVIDFLQHLEKFPNLMGGPKSSNRQIFAAILLHSLGRTTEALDELQIEEAHSKALLARDEYYRQGCEATMCEIKKLREFFAS